MLKGDDGDDKGGQKNCYRVLLLYYIYILYRYI